ncbi:hypothetical protein [Flavobacterium sp. WC2430]|uniref:hypothetical protein n=1 Tax=Flavobacterium sp. WC2430 TaxID=3234137 RepID=UPI00346798A5
MKQFSQIKKFYHDVLFMASARQNKGKVFYINPTQFKILLKLVHYEKTDDNITFQNKDIAKHIYLAESTVKDAIEEIRKMGYITSESKKYNNRLGFKSNRTINLDWDFIQKLYDEYILPNSKIDTSLSTPIEIISETSIIAIDEIDSVIIEEIINPLKFEKLPSTFEVKPPIAVEEITPHTEVAKVTIDKTMTEETLLKTEIKSDKKIREELEERLDKVKRKMAKNNQFEDYKDIFEMEKRSDEYSAEDLIFFLDLYENKLI